MNVHGLKEQKVKLVFVKKKKKNIQKYQSNPCYLHYHLRQAKTYKVTVTHKLKPRSTYVAMPTCRHMCGI